MKSAGAALSNAAAEFGAGEPKVIADHPEQRSFRRNVDRMPNSIHGKLYCHGVPSLIGSLVNAFLAVIDGDGRNPDPGSKRCTVASLHRRSLYLYQNRWTTPTPVQLAAAREIFHVPTVGRRKPRFSRSVAPL